MGIQYLGSMMKEVTDVYEFVFNWSLFLLNICMNDLIFLHRLCQHYRLYLKI